MRLVAFVARCRTVSDHERSRTPSRSRTGPCACCGRRTLGACCGARCSTPSSTAATTTFPPPTSGRASRRIGRHARQVRSARSWAGSDGGHQTLVDALGAAIERLRRRACCCNTPVRRILSSSAARPGTAAHARATSRTTRWSRLCCARATAPLLAASWPAALPARPCRYLGVVCLVARVRAQRQPLLRAQHHRPLACRSPSVVETTHVVDPEHVGGHLVYVPRYVQPDIARARAQHRRDHARLPRPGAPDVPLLLDPTRRDREPGGSRAASPSPCTAPGSRTAIPELFPAPGLVVASSAHVYPDIVHAQAHRAWPSALWSNCTHGWRPCSGRGGGVTARPRQIVVCQRRSR